jgi:hypothetical protein
MKLRGYQMKRFSTQVALSAVAALATLPASATYNATITGHIVSVQPLTPGAEYTGAAFAFTLDSGPATGCVPGGWHQFIISSASVPDTETRKNLIAVVMAAKAEDSSVVVGYDNAGGFCDQGSYGVYYISAS